jgi:catechol 2,3-dioxygenase-like lactoylglutathione lyase family enzyme
MIKPKAIDHIVLRTDRYQDLIDFYCNVLGCVLERTTSEEFGLTQLRAGSALIDIVDVNGKLGISGGPPPRETGNRKQETGNRKQETGNRKQETM